MLKWKGNEDLITDDTKYGKFQIRRIRKESYTYCVLELVVEDKEAVVMSQDVDVSMLKEEAVHQLKILESAVQGFMYAVKGWRQFTEVLKELISCMDIDDEVLDGDDVDEACAEYKFLLNRKNGNLSKEELEDGDRSWPKT